jgi:hypothetical protein
MVTWSARNDAIRVDGRRAVLFFTCSAVAAREDKWLCVGEASAGMTYRDKQWAPAIFSTINDRFIVQKPLDYFSKLSKKVSWSVTRIGSSMTVSICQDDFFGPHLRCSGSSRFDFNSDTLRFQIIYEVGYTYIPNDEGGDTPSITIGKCSPI